MKDFSLHLLRRLIAALAVVVLSACAGVDKDGNAYLGQPSSQLLSSLGTPSLRAPDGKGGEIWTYVHQSEAVGVSAGGVRGTSGYGAFGGPSSGAPGTALNPQGFTSRREFLIDSQGNVYQYRSRGM